MKSHTAVRLVLISVVLAAFAVVLRSGSTGSAAAQPPEPVQRTAQMTLTRDAPDLTLITAEDQERIVREAMTQRWRYVQDTAPVEMAPVAVDTASGGVNGGIAYSDLDGHLNMILPDGTARTSIVTDLANISDVSWSPDYGSVAFVADAEGGRALFTLRLRDRERAKLATGYRVLWTPLWSPDGQRITFSGMRPADTEVRGFFAPANGSSPEVELAPGLQVVQSPSWLDDHTLLVAGRSRVNVWNVYRIDVSAPGQFSGLFGDVACSDQCSCTDTSVLVANPLASPGGTKVAFISGRTEGDKSKCTAYYGLYVVDAAGGTPVKLADVADSSGTGTATVGTMAWHPDKDVLGLLAGGSDQVLRLTTVALDHTVTTLHGRQGGGWSGWGWSPDGTLMAAGYVQPGGTREVDVVQPATDGFTFLVEGGAPAWSRRPADNPVDLSGEFLEVTQAIQRDEEPYVPAIEKKDTWVRFSVKSAPANLENVAAVLHLTRPSGSGGSESRDVAARPDMIEVRLDGGSRDKVEQTFNFLLPAEWTTGVVSMRAEVGPEFQFTETDYANNVFPRLADPARTVTFEKVNKVSIYYYKFRFTDKEGKVKYAVSENGIAATTPYVKWTYPVPAADITLVDKGWIDVPLAEFDPTILSQWEKLIARAHCSVPEGSPDRCFGFVPQEIVPKPNPYWGYGNSLERLAICAVGYNDGRQYGSLYAHELGHSYLGGDHATIDDKIDNYGFHGDDTSQKVYTPQGYWDFMCPNTTCGMLIGKQWITAEKFEDLKEDIGAPKPGLAAMAAQAAQPYLTATGVITPDVSTQLVGAYSLERPAGFSDGPGSGPYRIELQSASGAVLAARNFEASSPDGFETASLSFAVTLPRAAGAEKIVIRSGSAILLTAGPVAGSLQVRLTTALDGASIERPTRINWALDGAASQYLRYTVEYSADGGATWQVVAVGLRQPTYLLDPAYLAGTTQGKVRVSASDRLLSAADVSAGAFRVPDRGPVVRIVSPEAGVRVPPRTIVNLAGTAYDQASNVLSGTALVWTIDGQAAGTGNYVSAENLPYGVHVVRLTATDGQGRSTTAEIRLRVTDYPHALYLPVLRR